MVIFVIINAISAKNVDTILKLAIVAGKVSPEAKALGMLMYDSGEARY